MVQTNSIIRYALLLLFAYLFFLILKPFIPAIVLALACVIVFSPATKWIMKKTKLGRGGASFLNVLLTVVFIVFPLVLLIGMLGNETLVFVREVDFESLIEGIKKLNVKVLNSDVDVELIKGRIVSIIGAIASYVSGKSMVIASSAWNTIFLFFVFLLLYYYLLKDSKKLLTDLEKLLPYEQSQKKDIFKSFQEISKTIFYGNLITALIAGVIAYIGFSLFGFKTPLIWALAATIFSFIPTIGTLIIYFTGIVILFIMWGWMPAGLMLGYFIAIDLLLRENYIKSKIMEDKLSFHPIIIFISLVGGVSAFGSMGLIYGPLIVTLLGSLYRFHTAK